MSILEHFIECPKFGGKRPAPACMHYDRYKSCRRNCKSLEAYVKANPNYQEVVEKHYTKKHCDEDKPAQQGLFVQTTLLGGLQAKHSGKNIPDYELACHLCSFVGKSKRGLYIHLRRTHKILKRKQQ